MSSKVKVCNHRNYPAVWCSSHTCPGHSTPETDVEAGAGEGSAAEVCIGDL